MMVATITARGDDAHTLTNMLVPPCEWPERLRRQAHPGCRSVPLGWIRYLQIYSVLVLSGFCFTTIQNSFVRPTTWSYPWASEMADAARPTHRPHARTPLTRARTHNSQCNSFESWPSRRSSSLGELGNSIVDLGATVHARRIACMEPFSAWWAGPWLG
jgi:hypothetical protein